jgi:hypothetical protein
LCHRIQSCIIIHGNDKTTEHEEEINETFGLCDQEIVMHQGRQIKSFFPGECPFIMMNDYHEAEYAPESIQFGESHLWLCLFQFVDRSAFRYGVVLIPSQPFIGISGGVWLFPAEDVIHWIFSGIIGVAS